MGAQNRKIGFDIVHHVTYVKHWSPSCLALLPHPFIWGPVRGAEAAPKPFWQDFSRRGKIYETLRALAQNVGERDRFVGLTARHSAIALATTEQTAARLRFLKAKNVKIFSQVGLSQQEIEELKKFPTPRIDKLNLLVSVVYYTGKECTWDSVHLRRQRWNNQNIGLSEMAQKGSV